MRRGWCEEAEQNCPGRPDAKGHVQGDSGDGGRGLPAEATCRVHKDSHLLVTRPGKAHLGACASDAAVHFGDRNPTLRLAFDLVE